MKVIAFGHRKYTGKDSAARFLQIHLNGSSKHSVKKRGFADKLKDIAHELYHWDGMKPKEYYEIYPDRKNEILPTIKKTVRQIWIELGIKMREIYEDTWIKCALLEDCNILLISDLRFPNEFDAIKKMGGYCIRIKRPSIPDTDDVADNALKNCVTWDDTIINDGDLKQFSNIILKSVERYLYE